MGNVDLGIELVNAKMTIARHLERVTELEELVDMLLDSESADECLRDCMYHAWLHKAKELTRR